MKTNMPKNSLKTLSEMILEIKMLMNTLKLNHSITDNGAVPGQAGNKEKIY